MHTNEKSFTSQPKQYTDVSFVDLNNNKGHVSSRRRQMRAISRIANETLSGSYLRAQGKLVDQVYLLLGYSL